jgi:hypothetical protein
MGEETMKTEKEIRDEVRRARERAAGLSGFWVPELAAAVYALEWALGKRADPASQDIGRADSAHGRLSETLLKAGQKNAASSAKSARPRKPRGSLRRVK